MTNLTPEMIEKAKAVKSAEELLTLAKENNVEMTADEAAKYFAQLNPKSGELSDDDLDNVAGGAGGCSNDNRVQNGDRVRVITGATCPKCGGTIGHAELDPIFEVHCENCSQGMRFVTIGTDIFSRVYGVDVERA